MRTCIQVALFCCLLISQVLQAQNWCPPGATWYFLSADPIHIGYEKAQYSKDTIIAGQSCKEIVDTSYNAGIYSPTVFTYNSNDTVFVFNHGTFLPYFYFNAHLGDTLLLPSGNGFINAYVDSTGIDTINGVGLRFYTFRVPDSLLTCYPGDTSYAYGGMVMERFGFIPPPSQLENSFSLGWSCFEYLAGYYLHCYQDDSFPLYSTDPTRSCDYINTGISAISLHDKINIYPNPSSDDCTLQLSGESEIFAAAIFDITGREVMPLFSNEYISTFHFNIALLPSGLYFVKASDAAGRTAMGKLVKEEK